MSCHFVVVLTALAVILTAGVPAAARDKIDISFEITHVEDRYALNAPLFRNMFRLLDIGYAGCSVELMVTSKGAKIPPDANSKIELSFLVQLGPGEPPYVNETNGSIARRSVPIYLKDRCAEISSIKIASVKCFEGFKGQWRNLACPYRFRTTEFSIPEYYHGDQ